MELVDWAFTDVNDMKLFLGLTDATQDDLLVTLINRASSFMERYTSRRLAAANYSSALEADKENCWYDGAANRWLTMRQYPIISVSSVVVSGATIAAAGATDYYGSTGYVIYKLRGMLFYDNGFDRGIQNVRVSYRAGYETTSREYSELQELCRSLVTRVYNNRTHLGFKSETLMNYQYTLADLKDERGGVGNLQNTLDGYRRKIIR